MNLFIDTNVLLTFFHMSGDDIEELEKLVEMLVHGNLTLWLPEQVCDEFERNRDVKIADAVKDIKNLKFGMPVPAFFRTYQNYNDITGALNNLNKLYSKLVTEVMSDVEARKLSADVVVGELFLKAKLLPHDQPTYARAIDRMRHGNPPGKKSSNTIGDELNWEHLLAGIPNDQDIHIVSGDGDWANATDKTRLHSFIEREWNLKKGGQAKLYTRLSAFFAEHFPEIKLASDVSRNAAIDQLAKSGAFYSTHLAIAALTPHLGSFSAAEVSKLVEIALTNSQVGWIMTDADVGDFYRALAPLQGVDPLTLGKLLELFKVPAPAVPAADDDGIPF